MVFICMSKEYFRVWYEAMGKTHKLDASMVELTACNDRWTLGSTSRCIIFLLVVVFMILYGISIDSSVNICISV